MDTGGRWANADELRIDDVEELDAGRLDARRRRAATASGRFANAGAAEPPTAPARPSSGPASRAEAQAFHYATRRVMRLGQAEDLLRSISSVPVRTRDREVELYVVQLKTAVGEPVRTEPRALPDALYIDYRDFRAMESGAIVPGLDEALTELRRLRTSRRDA